VISEFRSRAEILREEIARLSPRAVCPMNPWDRVRRIRWAYHEKVRENRRLSDPAIHYVPSLESQECVDLLLKLRARWAFLAYAPIIRRRLLATPGLIVLNAHGGLLPKYRGMNASAWCQLTGDPLGVTVHVVDEGVDTGPILAQTRVEDPSRVQAAQIDLLAEVLLALQAGQQLIPVPQHRSAGRQYYRIHPTLVGT
jgi:methionyl-tRNA formyltransferase